MSYHHSNPVNSQNTRPAGLPPPTYGLPQRPTNGWAAPIASNKNLYNRPPQPLQSRVAMVQVSPPPMAGVSLPPVPNIPTSQPQQYQYPQHPSEPYVSASEADKQINDLISGATADFEDVDLPKEATVPGMSGITLLKHQIAGVAWMRDRESGTKTNKHGGILADDMGLGKTVQTLAVISSNKPTKEQRKRYSRTTLIVAPLAVVQQWENEAKSKCDSIRVLVHHGSSRARDASIFESYDLVVTSYSVVSSEHKVYTDSSTKVQSNDKPKSGRASNKKPFCALFEYDFFRIVLDEAQNIKNRASKTSIACGELNGCFKWCLTGTPIQNKVEELFPLLRFLVIVPLNEWDEFKARIITPMANGRAKTAMKRLQVILKLILLRRTKDTQNDDGTALITLPGKHINLVQLNFDKDEQAFYTSIADKAQQTINKFMEDGDLKNKYTSVLTLLLRLRQACDHPHLVTKGYSKEDLVTNDVATTSTNANTTEEEEQANAADELADLFSGLGVNTGVTEKVDNDLQVKFNKLMGDELVDSAKIRAVMQILADVRVGKIPEGTEESDETDSAVVAKPKVDADADVDADAEKTKSAIDESSPEAKPSTSKSTSKSPPKPPRLDEAGFPTQTIDLSDSDEDDLDTIIKRTASMDIKKARGSDGSSGTEKKKKKKKSVASKKQNQRIVLSDSDEEDELAGSDDNDDDEDTDDDVKVVSDDKKEASRKGTTKKASNTTHTSTTHNDDTPEKTIIFSQFTSFLDILQKFVKAAGYKYVRYDGTMTPVEREYALDKIKNDKKTTVILISFKAGSTGLNLTACSRVILCDMWWNPALEDQAFDRAHRMGQKRKVYVYKLAVKDTVEDRILELQKSKREIADAALSGKAVSNKLGLREMLDLFKPSHHDGDDDES